MTTRRWTVREAHDCPGEYLIIDSRPGVPIVATVDDAQDAKLIAAAPNLLRLLVIAFDHSDKMPAVVKGEMIKLLNRLGVKG